VAVVLLVDIKMGNIQAIYDT